MGALNNVLDLLFQEPQGAIVVSNIVDCLDEGLVDGGFVRDFLDAAIAAFDTERPETTVATVGMLAKVARGKLLVASASTTSATRNFLLVYTVTAEEKYYSCSCVLNVGLFKEYFISDSKVNDGHTFFFPIPIRQIQN